MRRRGFTEGSVDGDALDSGDAVVSILSCVGTGHGAVI